MDLTVFLEPCDGGCYRVWVPALPGCHSEGDTEEEALTHIREAIELYLSPEPALPAPPVRALDVAV